MARVAAVAAALAVSSGQYRFFDCNEVPVLSFVVGAVTVLLAYGVGEVVFHVSTSERSAPEKLFVGAGVVLAGGALVGTVGFFTMVTHMCG